MQTVLIAIGFALAYLIAYHTYGRFVARKLFTLNPDAQTPARRFNDNTDFVPTRRERLFGHHATSTAGAGAIVGPVIGLVWGWAPAMIWALFGSIFMGAVHDFNAVVVSMRHEGKSIGDIAAAAGLSAKAAAFVNGSAKC